MEGHFSNISQAFVPDNARNESEHNIVANFIPPEMFWELFSAHHHVILGSRGSGKTSVARMASFSCLRNSLLKKAQEIVRQKQYIGVFVNTDIRFVGSTKENFLAQSKIKDLYFIWKFNTNCLKALSITIDNVLDEIFSDSPIKYVIERRVSEFILQKLLETTGSFRLKELDRVISDYEFSCRAKLNRSFLTGQIGTEHISGPLSLEMFEPIALVIRALKFEIAEALKVHSDFESRAQGIATSKWLFFIDEAEYLAVDHHRMLNSFMRTHTGDIFLKIATLPYKHKTLETNLDEPLQVDEDFSYKSLDRDPIYGLVTENSPSLIAFAERLYRKRVEGYIRENNWEIEPYLKDALSSLETVLGKSPLEAQRSLPDSLPATTKYLKQFLDPTTIERAKRLEKNPAEYGNQIWRKVSGLITLIEDRRSSKGRGLMSVYSGVETCVRCTDGTPRKMINLFHGFTIQVMKVAVNSRLKPRAYRANFLLSRVAQTKVVKAYSSTRVSSSLSIPESGPRMRQFIETVGRYFEDQLHNSPISTDVIASFQIADSIEDQKWALVQDGIAYGYIFRSDQSSEPSFQRAGQYRLAYSLCPFFDLFPRKGKSRALSAVLRYGAKSDSVQQLQLQLNLAPQQISGDE